MLARNGDQQTSACPSPPSPTPGNRDRAGKSQPSSAALAGSRELFLKPAYKGDLETSKKKAFLVQRRGGFVVERGTPGRFAFNSGLCYRPSCVSWAQPGLLPPARHPAPSSSPSSPRSPGTQPTGDSHRHQHPPPLPEENPARGLENPARGLENWPGQPRPRQEPGLLVPKKQKGGSPPS